MLSEKSPHTKRIFPPMPWLRTQLPVTLDHLQAYLDIVRNSFELHIAKELPKTQPKWNALLSIQMAFCKPTFCLEAFSDNTFRGQSLGTLSGGAA
jgi:hypothetical protein